MAETIPIEKVKKLGQVLTPYEIAEFLAGWAIRRPEDKVLEPSCGDGVFLRAVIRRLLELGMPRERVPLQVYGVDIDPYILEKTQKLLKSEFSITPTLINSDFFDLNPPIGQRTLLDSEQGNVIPKVNVIIGNPPYIRYQSFSGKTRKKALRTVQEAGVKLTELTASWVPFVIHSEKFLKKNGRLAMVLPSKILHVSYAKPFRKWLLKKFSNISIIAFEKRVFPGILEDTVLVLADKSGQRGVRFIEVGDENDLAHLDINTVDLAEISPNPNEKWTKYFIPQPLGRDFGAILKNIKDRVHTLGEIGFITIGVVTGGNQFFTLTEEEVKSWNIKDEYLIPLISRAEQISGVRITTQDWEFIKKVGQKCYLLYITKPWNQLDNDVKEYLIKRGQELNIMSRYKVRIRKVWYTVPHVKFPDLFMSYMAHEVPKLAFNEIEVGERRGTSTNTIHQIFLKRKIEPAVVSTVFYNSLTLASAELAGRFYGGGVLKIEPKEAEKILVPIPKNEFGISEISPKVDKLLRNHKVEEAVDLVNEVVLEGYLNMTQSEIEILNEVWGYLQKKRTRKGLS